MKESRHSFLTYSTLHVLQTEQAPKAITHISDNMFNDSLKSNYLTGGPAMQRSSAILFLNHCTTTCYDSST